MIRGRERVIWCSLAVLFTSGVATLRFGDLSVALIGVPLIAVAGLAGARVPFVAHILLDRREKRPDVSLWRWGAVALLLSSAIFGALLKSLPALACFSLGLSLIYAGAKMGCERAGCCRPTRHWPASAPSLPHLEVAASLAVAALCLSFLSSGIPAMAAALGVAGHFVVRTFSYWARGRSLIAAHTTRYAEILASVLFLLAIAYVSSA
jgi:hypothetical protein